MEKTNTKGYVAFGGKDPFYHITLDGDKTRCGISLADIIHSTFVEKGSAVLLQTVMVGEEAHLCPVCGEASLDEIRKFYGLPHVDVNYIIGVDPAKPDADTSKDGINGD